MQNTYRNAPQLETLRIRNELKTFRTGDSSKGSTPPPCLIILIILFMALGACSERQQ